MARWKFGIGEFFETLTRNELHDELGAYRTEAQAAQREQARGVKYARLNPPLTGQAVAGLLRMGGDYITGPAASGGASVGGQAGVLPQQPRAGYCWMARRADVAGLTTGPTPDVVNLYRRQSEAVAYIGGPAGVSGGRWQFNGNNFAYTFSFGELVYMEGETPILVSQGTFAATGIITLNMDF